MITSINIRAAKSIQEIQKVAHNQIKNLIYDLEERIEKLQKLEPLVESVVDWASYEQAIADVDEKGDARELTALYELAEHYGTMKAGNYF